MVYCYFVTPFSLIYTMIRYFVYVRKSQDRSDRQIMSLKGQINEIRRFARERGYEIVQIFQEQKSAKKPGRPVFNEMIERIQKGEANGILCWKLNRLARNPIDAGTISWLLQVNAIHAIHAKDRSYLPTDNVLMMQIDFGIANQFIKDLSGDVKRGMRDKAGDGWCPQSILPIGYLHHPDKQKAKKQIIPDPDRFNIVAELWKSMETGAYSVYEIKQMADQYGLVNRNGNPFALSTFHLMFKNPMYYGKFYWENEDKNKVLWKGKHKPMISEHTFRTVQQIIKGRNAKTGAQTHFYTYRGLITCGECNGHVTAERKRQVICTNCKFKYSIVTNEQCRKCKTMYSEMKNPTVIDITYYRCTKRKNPSCSQKTITQKKIEQTLIEVLEAISIPTELFDFGMKYVHQHAAKKHEGGAVLMDSLRKKAGRLKEKIKNLIDLRVSGEITKDQAVSMQEDYQEALEQTEQKIFEKENAQEIEIQETISYLKFAKNCVEKFKNGDQQTKKELIAFFCSNLTLMNKSLYFSTKKAPDIINMMQMMLFRNSARSNKEIAEVI